MENISGINLLFATHSPYILSDIPDNYVLKLEKGKPDYSTFLTFGANIHDLLRRSFFMKKGVMGEFAKNQIKDLIDWLKLGIVSQTQPQTQNVISIVGDWTPEKARKVIDAIGEPMIRNDLNELYALAFLQTTSDIDKEIERLKKIKIERIKRAQATNESEES